MKLVDVYPPMALAVIAASFWFMIAYRHSKSDPQGENLKTIAWVLIPLVGIGLYFYLNGLDAPITTPFGMFMASLAGVFFGGLMVWFLRTTFTERHETGHFIYRILGLSVFSFVLLGGFFIGQ